MPDEGDRCEDWYEDMMVFISESPWSWETPIVTFDSFITQTIPPCIGICDRLLLVFIGLALYLGKIRGLSRKKITGEAAACSFYKSFS